MKSGKKQTALKLRTARLRKGLSQQGVASRAGMHVKAYQRLEYGERDIGNASMKVGLTVCLVLDLDPFLLVLGSKTPPNEK